MRQTKRKATRQASTPAQVLDLEIESIDLEGQGVAHHEGKVYFVQGGITGERVLAQVVKQKPSYGRAVVTQVLQPSALRVQPACPHFGVCGGCSVQHVHPHAQVAIKNRVLEDLLWRIGQQKPQRMLPPVFGPFWAYRHRARLAARWVEKKSSMLVGFHERASSFVADMQVCHVLPPHVSALLMPLRALLRGLSICTHVPQIELAVGEGADAQPSTALVLRHLVPVPADDMAALRAFAHTHKVVWWLQPQGPETAHPLDAGADDLYYRIPSFNINLHFRPTDFTQVNHAMNNTMVGEALRLLDCSPGDRVVDLFCGLGNFSLPLATQSAHVLGLEGAQGLVDRAADNARRNGLAHKTAFAVRNLFTMDTTEWYALGAFDKALIDPPRDGALEVCKAIATAPATHQPARIVYVSCNPATLARDAGVLCHTGAYRLQAAGVVNMFPQTAHVESMAVFERIGMV